MPNLILREVNDSWDEPGREIARAFVPKRFVTDVVELIDRAISFGYELSYVEVEDE